MVCEVHQETENFNLWEKHFKEKALKSHDFWNHLIEKYG